MDSQKKHTSTKKEVGEGGSPSSDETLDRRSYLKLSAVAVGGATTTMAGVASAESTGYGAGGYGEGSYGGTDSDTSVVVSTGSPATVGKQSATLTGSLDDLGGASSADCYFQVRESGASTWATTSSQTLSSTGSYELEIGGLSSGTEYEYRAVAGASDGDTDTGSTVLFTTATDSPVAVSTQAAADIGEQLATLTGYLDDLGGASSADCYFQVRESGASSWTATGAQTLSSTGGYSSEISGLSAGTEYEYRAVVDASDGDADTGDIVSFTTVSSASAPTVDAFNVSESGSPNPHADITVGWGVTDADADLDTVVIEVFTTGGVKMESLKTNVSGSTANDTNDLKIKHGGNTTYDVTLTVTDMKGNTDSQTKTIQA